MAARRIAKSAVDWVAFAERVPANQKDVYRAFKGRSDLLLGRVLSRNESAPAIDWSFYKNRLANPAMADAFQKQYEALSVPYPKDKDNMKAAIDTQAKDAEAQSQKEIAAARQHIEEAKAMLAKIGSLPPLEEMTHEMYADYFPDQARSAAKPTMWPHGKTWQPGQHPEHEIK